jgi:tetratricopeptide (TPR) repeat protein
MGETPRLEIKTLGRFQIWRNGCYIDDYGSMEVEKLIQILLSADGPVDAGLLADYVGISGGVFGGLTAIVQRADLALEPDLDPAQDDAQSGFIRQVEGGYLFDVGDNVEIDALTFESLSRRADTLFGEGRIDEAFDFYERAVSAYTGGYLPESYMEPWAMPRYDNLLRTYAGALNRMADISVMRGQFDEAIRLARLSLKNHAYDESTHRRLMRYYACRMDKERAERVFENAQRLFVQLSMAQISAVTRRLYDDIMADREISCTEADI